MRINLKAAAKNNAAFIYAAAALIIALAADITARLCGGFAEWYAENIYPLFVNTIGAAVGLLPFSASEWLIYLAVAAAVTGIVLLIIGLIRGKGRRKRLIKRAAAIVLCALTSAYMIYTLFCGINYNRVPFSGKSGFQVQTYTTQDLADLCVYLIKNANTAAEEIDTDENGLMTVDNMQLEKECAAAMEKLGGQFTSLSGRYPAAKAVLFSEFMSHCRILGIYSPFFIEANYNAAAPDYAKPMTLCHELSHLKGFMREDEANYIAYLACRESDNAQLRYSAYVHALNYALNAFYPLVDSELYKELYSYIHPTVRAELSANAKFWKQYETPIAQVSEAVNDSYLKAQGQTDGKKSYGRFVDLMIYELKSTA